MVQEAIPKGVFEHPLEIPEAKKPVLPDIPPTEDEVPSDTKVLGITVKASSKSGVEGKEDETKGSSLTSSAAATSSNATTRLPPSVPSMTPPPYTPSTSSGVGGSSTLTPPPKSPVDEFTALAERLEAFKRR